MAAVDQEVPTIADAIAQDFGQLLAERLLPRGRNRVGGEDRGDGLVVEVELLLQTVAVLGVVGRAVRGHNDALAATDAAPAAGIALGHPSHVVSEEDQVGPLLEQWSHLLGELELVAVVAADLIGGLELAHRGVREEDDVHATAQERIERGQELGELLGHEHVALAVAEVLDGFFVGLAAKMLGQALLEPVGRVDNEALEFVAATGELSGSSGDVFPRARVGKTHHVEVMGSALGIEEDGRGELAGERGLAHALGAVDHGFLRTRDLAARQQYIGILHIGVRRRVRFLVAPGRQSRLVALAGCDTAGSAHA